MSRHPYLTTFLLCSVLILSMPTPLPASSTGSAGKAMTPINSFILLTDSALPPGPEIRFPFPHHVKYAAGTILPSHRSQTQLDNDVRRAYDDWKNTYLKTVPGSTDHQGPVYRVSYGKLNWDRTVSEGQGYGMVIVALMAGYDSEARTIFDGLWHYVRTHPSSVDSRLMTWQIPEEPAEGADSAFDGDADIAYGLLLAHAQWGSQGNVDYLAAAKELLIAIKESTIGAESHLPLLGDWINHEEPGSPYNQYTPRTSDFMPGHFRSFARFSGDSIWLQVVTACQQAISSVQTRYSPTTGLLPDFLMPFSSSDHRLKPVGPNFLEGSHDGHYDYNAGRDPWRIGTDALLNGDEISLGQARKIANWIYQDTGGRATAIKSGYTLQGEPTNHYDFTTFFAAPFGVATMTVPDHQQFLNDIYNAVVTKREDYYEDSVTLLCLLVMTGNFWAP